MYVRKQWIVYTELKDHISNLAPHDKKIYTRHSKVSMGPGHTLEFKQIVFLCVHIIQLKV